MLSVTVTAVGADPAEKEDPGTAVSAPVVRFTENPETLFPELFTTYKRLPDRSKLSENGVNTPPNGEPANCFNFPLFVFRL